VGASDSDRKRLEDVYTPPRPISAVDASRLLLDKQLRLQFFMFVLHNQRKKRHFRSIVFRLTMALTNRGLSKTGLQLISGSVDLAPVMNYTSFLEAKKKNLLKEKARTRYAFSASTAESKQACSV
jgi:hypothetical protein